MVFKQNHEKYLYDSIIDNNSSKPNDGEILDFYQYKNYLLNKYGNYSFEDIGGSAVESNEYGDVFKIVNKEPIEFKIEDKDYKSNLKHNLKLVPGIGIVKEAKLKEEGYNTIEDLENHKLYSQKANDTLKNIESFEINELVNFIKKNQYGIGCKLNTLKTACLFDYEDFKFMDIETLGLSNVPIILIGVAEIKNNNIISTQYLMRDIVEEPAGLNAFISHLNEDSAHVTFNGKFFDVPYIKNRLKYYRMSTNELNIPHFDLLYYARHLWKDKLPNCKLQTIEKHIFGLERNGDVPGQYIPDYYKTYLDTGNIGPLIPIVEHNKQDIISLASFLMKMYNEVNGD